MITVKEKIRLIESCFGEARITADNKNAVVFCPACKAQGKDKRKLSIGIDKGMYHCWVCEIKGQNIGQLALKYALQKKAATDLYTYFKGDKDEQLPEEERKIVELPEDFRLIGSSGRHEGKLARAYLKNRGYTDQDIWKFRVGTSNEYQFRNRVIFPSFDAEQNLNYYTARSILPDEKRRYYNCVAKRKDIIFNEVDIDFSKELIITEGVFDLLNCPNNATCLLGSWISKDYYLFQQIVENKTPIILCLDYDAKEKEQKIAKLFYEYGINVKITQHSKKDFGDMSKEEINYWLKESKPFNNVDRISYLIKNIKSGSMY